MGMDILFNRGDFRCSARFWGECLTLAEVFGWIAAGTEAPCECVQGVITRDWGGGYGTNDYQQVTDEDARAFAAALKRGIEALMMEPPLTIEQAERVKVFDEMITDNINYPGRIGDIKTSGVPRIAELATLASDGGFVIR